ncbi:CLUMA_CG005789, isoform A [Clunio marinus]|uniref:CLUMA_CG005789, isoform A n=1 Tax=Clunio marinus TaxID=568069 RepID=A0A1J1HY24_9DIPT|nr:CLUMA_CG005789, isoform A [Clunio marinus]
MSVEEKENIEKKRKKECRLNKFPCLNDGDDGDDEKLMEMKKRNDLINSCNQSKWNSFNQLTMQLKLMGVCRRRDFVFIRRVPENIHEIE